MNATKKIIIGCIFCLLTLWGMYACTNKNLTPTLRGIPQITPSQIPDSIISESHLDAILQSKVNAGGGATTEAELETAITDVTNIYTNNDGVFPALDADFHTLNAETLTADTDEILIWDASILCYLNATLQSTYTTGTGGTHKDDASNNFTIEDFEGQIDEVCLWDRVLSEIEIRQIYAMQKGGYGIID